MIEQYIYNRISQDETLATLLENVEGGVHLYPAVVPRGANASSAMTFTQIGSTDAYPNVTSVNIQFNIFSTKHSQVAAMAKALADIFNEDHLQTEGGTSVVFSQRQSESDLGFDYNEKEYQRQSTYYFKLR